MFCLIKKYIFSKTSIMVIENSQSKHFTFCSIRDFRLKECSTVGVLKYQFNVLLFSAGWDSQQGVKDQAYLCVHVTTRSLCLSLCWPPELAVVM